MFILSMTPEERRNPNIIGVSRRRSLAGANKSRLSCPDLVLLDWELPGMPVVELLRTLRAVRPGLLVITLNSRPQTRRVALAAGADKFASKSDPLERLFPAGRSCRALWETILRS